MIDVPSLSREGRAALVQACQSFKQTIEEFLAVAAASAPSDTSQASLAPEGIETAAENKKNQPRNWQENDRLLRNLPNNIVYIS